MKEALTFDDVLLQPGGSRVTPAEASLATSLGRGFGLALPVLSAAMDTVTESQMAIAMAQNGGLGVVHRNLSPQEQADEVERVKRFESGVVFKPVTVTPNMTVAQALQIQKRQGISGLPVLAEDGRVCGIVTNRDLRFETRHNLPLSKVMTPRERLIVARPNYTLRAVKALMHSHRIERVIIADKNDKLRGLLTVRDILRTQNFPLASKDGKGRLRVAAAVGVGDLARARLLLDAGCDALALDSAHGHSAGVLAATAALKKLCAGEQTLLIAGNVATAAGALALAKAGANVVKVGIGPGSICTTRIVAGVGVPQLTAIQQAAAALRGGRARVVADGGMRYSGDIAKALAAGADAVMLGALLAGTEESPGENEIYQGRAYKRYRGMGSLAAMQAGGAARYFQRAAAEEALVPEGIEGRVPYKGRAADVLHLLGGGARAAMGYVGAATLPQLRARARFLRITNAGARESHAHSVEITREAPNYQVD